MSARIKVTLARDLTAGELALDTPGGYAADDVVAPAGSEVEVSAENGDSVEITNLAFDPFAVGWVPRDALLGLDGPNDGYYCCADQVVSFRVFVDDDDLSFTLDAIDGKGGYTDALYTGFATREAAVAFVPTLAKELGLSADLPVVHVSQSIDDDELQTAIAELHEMSARRQR
jgi:hypothetical protein